MIEPRIFLSGGPKTGTSITSRAIAAHPAYRFINESRAFMRDPRDPDRVTLHDLFHPVDRRRTLARFRERFWHDVYMPVVPGVGPAGLSACGTQMHVVKKAFQELLKEYSSLSTSPAAAIARFTDTVFSHPSARSWIEKTPLQYVAFPCLRQAFPDAVFIITDRAPERTAQSLLREPWGPDDLDECLRQAEDFRACALDIADQMGTGDNGVIVSRLEDFVLDPSRLIDALEERGVPSDGTDAIREFHANQVDPTRPG